MATAVGAQILWGVFPAFIKLFQGVIAPEDFVAHRAIWSFTTLVTGLAIASRASSSKLSRASQETTLLQRLYGNYITVGIALLATLFIATNWITFVWAVSNDHAIDASLGYYICPQIVVLLGVFFLGERLGSIQWLAVSLATVGVLIMTWSADAMIWIGLVVAVAFAFYALVKKKTSLTAAEGLTVETSFMLVPAIIFLYWRSSIGGVVWPESFTIKTLLLISGPMTVAPLFLYAIAVKHISLSTVGLLQFIGPTIQFFLGVFAFGEPFDSVRLVGFVLVWIGVGLYLFALTRRRVSTSD